MSASGSRGEADLGPDGAVRGEQARSTADAVARRSYGKLVAFLAARTRDVAAAEDALADAFAAALADWPANGCPANPEAWLLTAARRRLIDAQRRRQTSDAAAVELRVLATALDEAVEADEHASIPDQRLKLMFACAHPAIDAAVHAPLILQTLLGFDAAMIASAFLVSARRHGPTARAREGEDSRGRHSAARSGARRAAASARHGARRDLRDVRRGLG